MFVKNRFFLGFILFFIVIFSFDVLCEQCSSYSFSDLNENDEIGKNTQITMYSTQSWEGIQLFIKDEFDTYKTLSLSDCEGSNVCVKEFSSFDNYQSLTGTADIKIRTPSNQVFCEREVKIDTKPFFNSDFSYSYLLSFDKLVISIKLNDDEKDDLNQLSSISNYIVIEENNNNILFERVYISEDKLKIEFSQSQTNYFKDRSVNLDITFNDKFENEKTNEIIIDLVNDFSVINDVVGKIDFFNNNISFVVNSNKDISEAFLTMTDCNINAVGIVDEDKPLHQIDFIFNISAEYRHKTSCNYNLRIKSDGMEYSVDSATFQVDTSKPNVDNFILDKYQHLTIDDLDDLKYKLENTINTNNKKFQFNVTSNEPIYNVSVESECLDLTNKFIYNNKLYFNVTLKDSYYSDNSAGDFDFLNSYMSCKTNVTIFDNSLNNKTKSFDFMDDYFVDFAPSYYLNEMTDGKVDKIQQKIVINLTATQDNNLFRKIFLRNNTGNLNGHLAVDGKYDFTFDDYWDIDDQLNYSVIIANVTSRLIKRKLEIDNSIPEIISNGFSKDDKICKESSLKFKIVSDMKIKNFTLRGTGFPTQTESCIELGKYYKTCNKTVNINSDASNLEYNITLCNINDVCINSTSKEIEFDHESPVLTYPNKFYHVNSEELIKVVFNDSNEILYSDITISESGVSVEDCKYDFWNGKTECIFNISNYYNPNLGSIFNITIININDICNNEDTVDKKIKLLYDNQPPNITNSIGIDIESLLTNDNAYLKLGTIGNSYLKKDENFKFDLYFLESDNYGYEVNISVNNLTSRDSQLNISLKNGEGCNLVEETDNLEFRNSHYGKILIHCSYDRPVVQIWNEGVNHSIKINITDFAGNSVEKLQNYSVISSSQAIIDDINNLEQEFNIPNALPATLLNKVNNYPFLFSMRFQPITGHEQIDFDIISYSLDNCDFYSYDDPEIEDDGLVYEDVYDDSTVTFNSYQIDGGVNIENQIFLNFANKLDDRSAENITMICDARFNYIFFTDNGIVISGGQDLSYNMQIDLYDMTMPGDNVLKTIKKEVCDNPFVKIENYLEQSYNLVSLGQDFCAIKDDLAKVVEIVFEPIMQISAVIDGALTPFLGPGTMSSVINGLDSLRNKINKLSNDFFGYSYVEGVCNALTCKNEKLYNTNREYFSTLYAGMDSNDIPTSSESLLVSVGTGCIPTILEHYFQMTSPNCDYGLCLLNSLNNQDNDLGYNCKQEKDYNTCFYWGKQAIYSSPLYGLQLFISKFIGSIFGADILSTFTQTTTNLLSNSACRLLSFSPFMQGVFGCLDVSPETDYVWGEKESINKALKSTQDIIKLPNLLLSFDWSNIEDEIAEIFKDWGNDVINSFEILGRMSDDELSLSEVFDGQTWESFWDGKDDMNSCKYFNTPSSSNITMLGIEFEQLSQDLQDKYGDVNNLTVCQYLEEVYPQFDEEGVTNEE